MPLESNFPLGTWYPEASGGLRMKSKQPSKQVSKISKFRFLLGSSRTPPVLLMAVVGAFIVLFQNCAPAPLQSREMASGDQIGDQITDVPMSKVTVHLSHDSNVALSDVELVADDVMHSIDDVPDADDPEQIVAGKFSGGTSVIASATPNSPSSFDLELPLGSEKIIVARAKVRDPASNQVASYYGNKVVTLNNSVGEITIQMVALPQ